MRVTAGETAWAKRAAASRIYSYLEKRTREYEWWSPPGNVPTVTAPENAQKRCAEQRRTAIDAYIAEVREKTGKRITRSDIWRKVGYRSRTVFECWQRCDPKRPNKVAAERFSAILREKPHLK
jgi:hypothetical protein